MIKVIDKRDCSGCTACANICPKSCIQMKPDKEGFLYPEVDESQCVKCNACDTACPILNPVAEKKDIQKAYLVQHRDEKVRLDSSAGGAFTAIATVILQKGGVVFGAAYDENFHVKHNYVETVDELNKFRNSKYVQSEIGDSFRLVKDFLQKGRWVCFSGTPCQIEGLSKFLRKSYEKLVLIDVVCHGVPSPLIWDKYLEYQNVPNNKPDNIRFRDKFYGYKYSTMSIIRRGKAEYHAGSQLDPMLRAFFSDICDRPTCYNCKFKKRYRVSDITIWDCFSVYNFDKKMDDDKGTTRVLCHSEKGVEIIEEVEKYAVCKEVPADNLVKGVREMFESVGTNENRDDFFNDAQLLDGKALFEKYYPITPNVRIKTQIRKFLLITGLYRVAKKFLNKMRGR